MQWFSSCIDFVENNQIIHINNQLFLQYFSLFLQVYHKNAFWGHNEMKIQMWVSGGCVGFNLQLFIPFQLLFRLSNTNGHVAMILFANWNSKGRTVYGEIELNRIFMWIGSFFLSFRIIERIWMCPPAKWRNETIKNLLWT